MKSNRLAAWGVSWLEQVLIRRAPQDDAFSYTALIAALTAYLSVGLLQAASSSAWAVAWSLAAADTLLMVLFAWAVLQLAGKSARLVQALTALAGTGALLGLVGLPLVLQAVRAHEHGGPSASLVTAWLVLLAWSIAVQAHIFRHALSTRYGIGLMVAGLHTALGIALLETLFPKIAGSG